jgi:hypothetical protein
MTIRSHASGLHVTTIALAAALASSAFAAQDEPAPQPPAPAPTAPGAPAPPPSETGSRGISLIFKHAAGQVQKFRANVQGDLTLTPEGDGGGIGAIPISLKMAYAITEKVTGTRRGTATLSTLLDSATIASGFAGNTIVMKALNGKMTVSVNGRPVPAGAPGAAGFSGVQQINLRIPAITRRDPRGRVTAASNRPDPISQLFGSSSATILHLPDKPVEVGESWESTQRIQPTVPGGAAAGIAPPAIELRLTHTLKSVSVKNGRRFAIIESTGSSETSQGGQSASNQSISGISRFDVTRGALVSQQYNADMGVQLPMPANAAAPPGAPQSLRMDGIMTVTITEAVAAGNKAAPGRKPARKR